MSGEARADIVNSFLLGSIRSQRAMTTEARRRTHGSTVTATVSPRPRVAYLQADRDEPCRGIHQAGCRGGRHRAK